MRTMDRGFTTNANDKTEWKCFRIFGALVLKLISENSLQDIYRINANSYYTKGTCVYKTMLK